MSRQIPGLRETGQVLVRICAQLTHGSRSDFSSANEKTGQVLVRTPGGSQNVILGSYEG